MKAIDCFIDKIKNPKQEEVEEPKCVHNPAGSCQNSTLIKSSKRMLVHPEVQDYFCKVCKNTFRYTKHGDIYTLVKSD